MVKNNIHLMAVVGFTFFFLANLNGYGAGKWVSFAKSENGDEYYYDEASLKQVAKKVTQVWKMKRLSTVSKGDYVKRDKKYINLNSVNTLVELDCKKKTIKSLSLVYYDDKGNISEQYDNPDSGRRQARPTSRSELLLNTVCSK
jgi:hypothetical protein